MSLNNFFLGFIVLYMSCLFIAMFAFIISGIIKALTWFASILNPEVAAITAAGIGVIVLFVYICNEIGKRINAYLD